MIRMRQKPPEYAFPRGEPGSWERSGQHVGRQLGPGSLRAAVVVARNLGTEEPVKQVRGTNFSDRHAPWPGAGALGSWFCAWQLWPGKAAAFSPPSPHPGPQARGVLDCWTGVLDCCLRCFYTQGLLQFRKPGIFRVRCHAAASFGCFRKSTRCDLNIEGVHFSTRPEAQNVALARLSPST